MKEQLLCERPQPTRSLPRPFRPAYAGPGIGRSRLTAELCRAPFPMVVSGASPAYSTKDRSLTFGIVSTLKGRSGIPEAGRLAFARSYGFGLPSADS